MFGEEKNLKNLTDTNSPLPSLPLTKGEEQGGGLSYKKTDKLITALYMVTDIIDKDEPIRNKLRTLGTELISDMHLVKQNNTGYTLSFMRHKIAEIMSFLDIASAVNIISEMNCNILRKEFSELNQSILVGSNKAQVLNRQINLAEFLFEAPLLGEEEVGGGDYSARQDLVERENSKGHTSLGVQKGSTLLKALSGVKMPVHHATLSNIKTEHVASAIVFDALKKQRRDSIINIIKTITGGATIKDIKDKARTNSEKFSAIISCSEKTLQRELVSMVKDNVLDKTGEKRWSKYFLKAN